MQFDYIMQRVKFLWLILSISAVKSWSFNSDFQAGSSNSRENKNGKTQIPDLHRLPNQVIPVSYELRMAPDLENFTFRGEVNIIVRVVFTTDQIILHSKNLIIENVTIKKVADSTRSTSNTDTLTYTHMLDEANDFIVIKTDQSFEYNTDYKISIIFQGILKAFASEDNEPVGFYRTSYTINNQTRWLATTQFEATEARRAFPCFDEPRYRTPFTIYLAHDDNHIAASNMPSEVRLPPDTLSNGLIWEKFQPTPPMPTYLVAFMVSDFLSLKSEDERIRVIARPNAIQQSGYALQQGTKLLKYFEGYTGIAYSLPKLDIIAVPYFPTCMENWGMTVYNEENMILNDIDSEEQKKNITTLISHELSHLWFGDLVTPAWYDYLWIKEGFATYFETFGTAAIEPSWDQDHIFVVQLLQESLWSEFSQPEPMTRPIRTFEAISSSFDGISYDKAGSVIRMFELMLSPSTFQNALHNYLKVGQQHQKGVAVPKTLFDAFDKQVELDSVSHLPPHVSASDIMKSWTENFGYPLITVTRSYEQGEVIITQSPYKTSKAFEDAQPDQKWIVPLTYTTKSQLQFSDVTPVHWSIADEPTKLSGFNKSDWVLFNLKQSGYYRVNYDTLNWKLLISQLMENHTKIHVLNRAQLIDDAFALAYAGKIEFSIIVYLLEYLQNETSMIPWYSALRSFALLMDTFRFTTIEKFINEYLKEVLKKPVKNIGCNILPEDNHVVKILKPTFLTFLNKLGIDDCINELLEIYEKNSNNFNKIQPDLKPVVFCNALRYSNDSKRVYDHLWNAYTENNVVKGNRKILELFFTCTNDEEVIKSILSKIFDPKNEEISHQDASHIINKFISETLTVTASIKFIDEKIIPTISALDRNGVALFGTLISSILSNIKTKEQAQLFQQMEIKWLNLNTLERKKSNDP